MASIKEIRQKYPMYKDVSDDQLLQGLHKKHYSQMPYEEFAGKIEGYGQPTQPQDGKVEESIGNRARSLITGAAQGLTFGYADELKSALTGRPVEEIREEDEAVKKTYPATHLVGDVGGSIASAGGLLGKAVGTGGKLGARVLRGAVAGAGEGALSGFGRGSGGAENRVSNAKTGGMIGGVLGGVAPAIMSAGKSIMKPFSSKLRLAGKKTGIKNIVENRDSLGKLKTGISSSDELASKMDDVAPEMRKAIYGKTSNSIKKVFGKTRIDVEKSIANKDKMIKDFYSANGKKVVKLGDDFTKGMNPEQIEMTMKALKTGAKRTTSAPNTLNALSNAKRELQSKIQSSMIPDPQNPMKLIATPETAQLQKVVSKLDGTLKKSVSGYGKVNKAFSNTQKVKSAYEMGLKGSEKGLKLMDSNVQKQAYKQGLKKSLLNSVDEAGFSTGEDISKKILKKEGLYRDVLGSKKSSLLAKRLNKLSNATKDVNNIQKTAYTKLGRDVSELPFGRETLESRGSMVGSVLDKIGGTLQGKTREKTAKALLLGGKEFAPSHAKTGARMFGALMPATGE